MPSSRKILRNSIFLLLALLLALVAWLNFYDWNRFKPSLNQRVSVASGREFAINGDLVLSWRRPDLPFEGWQRWLPWPHLRAYDVTVGNPEWASSGPRMGRIGQIDFDIELLPLLRRLVSVRSLVLTEPDLVLEQDQDRRNNWSFDTGASPDSGWRMELQDIRITHGRLRLLLAPKKIDATVRIDTLTEGANQGGVRWELEGEMNGEKLSGDGSAGSLLSLQQAGTAYPVRAQLKVGQTEIGIDGTLTDPARLSALDIELRIVGASMSQLFPLSGIVLPETPKFSVQGRLHGKLGKEDTALTYQDFQGRVGSSDLSGTLEYMQRKPRPLLRGAVRSERLVFKDLGALVGADASTRRQRRGDQPRQPRGKLIPVAKFRAERWDSIDADVKFSGTQIIHSEKLPLSDLETRIQLQDGVLHLAPLRFGVAGGRLETDLRIDGGQVPPGAKMEITARGLQLRRLFPQVEEMGASVGELYGNASLSAVGDSPATLLASANGEVKALVSQGSMSKLILEASGLNLGSVIVARLFGDRQVRLNCLAADFKVTNGVMATRMFILDTEAATLVVDGKIDLGRERLDLNMRSDSKGPRLLSLRSPLYVRGSFRKPQVGIDTGAVALRAGAATLLGAVAAPLASLLALVDAGEQKEAPCDALLAQARHPPQAPPATPGRQQKVRAK